MCGLAGFVAADGAAAPDPGALERAVELLRHRGPDGAGRFRSARAALGHTRLAIIDVEGGAQPLANEDGTVVAVYNGEIWNHLALRRLLEAAGHRFRTRTDTEVLVHGYEEWGDALPSRLHGMFAFAIRDERRGRLLLARDRVGKKPLYVRRGADGLAFASDARVVPLLAGVSAELDRPRVAQYLFQRYVPGPATLLRDVERLTPGHLLVYDGVRAEERPYWRLEPGPERELPPEELRDLLRDAVAERLMSDVPLGVFLSGGVDSAAVLALAREAGAEGIASFTIGFDDPLYDERPLARVAAARLGSVHHEVAVDGRAFLDAMPRLAWLRDEPIAEPSEVPLLLLAEEAARHVKVVLGGDGGDELFGGYPKYRADALLRLGVPGLAPALRGAGALLARRPSHRRLARAVETMAIADLHERWASWFRSFAPAELHGLLAPDLRAGAAPERLAGPLALALGPYASLDAGRRMLVGDFLTYLRDNMLLRTDKVLMAASLEGRLPLLDQAVVERASAAPAAARAALRGPKAVLRAAVADLVPAEILSAPKRGFPVPVARFLLGAEGRPLQRLLTSERCLERGVLDPDAVRRLVAGGGPAVDRELKLFTLASLELWLRCTIDGDLHAPPESFDELLGEPVAAAA